MGLYEDQGFVQITWTNALKDLNFLAWRVYRRKVTELAWTMLVETSDDEPLYLYQDWLAESGETYEYTVVQLATRFGTPAEGDYVPSDPVTPISSHYWLINPEDSSQNYRLSQIISDNYAEMYEQESFHIIGRGRKTDYGDRLGFEGQLVAQVRDVDGMSARQFKKNLEAAKAQKREYFLRNPFGDIWQITMGDLQVSRMAGVGRAEYCDITIPYTEVA